MTKGKQTILVVEDDAAVRRGIVDALQFQGFDVLQAEDAESGTRAAVRAGYGPTVRAQSVKKLVDAVVNFQERSRDIIAEMRTASTRNSEEIREAVEDGKRRLSQLAAEGNALLLEG